MATTGQPTPCLGVPESERAALAEIDVPAEFVPTLLEEASMMVIGRASDFDVLERSQSLEPELDAALAGLQESTRAAGLDELGGGERLHACGDRSVSGAGLTQDTITLTRAEASAISGELLWSADSFWIAENIRDRDLDATNPDGVLLAIEDLQDVIERLRLEATIRNSGGWWGKNSPGDLDLMARYHAGACPDTFTLDSDGAAALRTFCTDRLPQAIALVDENLANGLPLDRPENLRRRAALVSLAARLEIELSGEVA